MGRKELLLLRSQPRLLFINGIVALLIAAVSPLLYLSASAAPHLAAIAHVRRILPVIPLVLVWGLSAGNIWGSRVRGEWTMIRLAPVAFLDIWLGTVFSLAGTAMLMGVVAWVAYVIGALVLGVCPIASLTAMDVFLLTVVTPLAVVALAGWAVLLFLSSQHPRAGNAVFAVVLVATVSGGGFPSGNAAPVVGLAAALLFLAAAVVASSRFHVHRHIAP